MKIFLTGGAGFIGSHIADSLVKLGHEVIIYDNFSSGHRDNLSSIKKDITLIEGDILDTKKVFSSCPKDVDVISHQAAQLEIFGCLENPVMDLQTNTVGTINILELARLKNIKKVINASSACVYGQARYTPQDEKHPTLPHWPYGASKLVAEHYARIYMESYGINIVSLRYGIVYGPREWYGRVLTMFLSRILGGQSPVIFGDGSSVRDFIAVNDVVDFHNRCLTNDAVFGKSFNVGSGNGTSVSELATLACQILTKGKISPLFEEVQEGAFSKNMPTRKRIPHELKSMVLSFEQANQITGFKPQGSLAQGVQKEYEWISNYPDRWDEASVVKV